MWLPDIYSCAVILLALCVRQLLSLTVPRVHIKCKYMHMYSTVMFLYMYNVTYMWMLQLDWACIANMGRFYHSTYSWIGVHIKIYGQCELNVTDGIPDDVIVQVLWCNAMLSGHSPLSLSLSLSLPSSPFSPMQFSLEGVPWWPAEDKMSTQCYK